MLKCLFALFSFTLLPLTVCECCRNLFCTRQTLLNEAMNSIFVITTHTLHLNKS